MKLLYITNGITGSGGLERVLSVKASLLAEKLEYEDHLLSLNEPELDAAFSNLNFDQQPLSLKAVLYLMKRKMALSYLMYRSMVSRIKI